ncbi:DUF3332 family protein [Leptospira perolatii]|nr:DUF3332 family protein [Leptospira perolatii]
MIKTSFLRRATLIAMICSFFIGSLANCYGKFAIFEKVKEVNGQVKMQNATATKFLQSVVTFFLIVFPVYLVAVLADWIVFNVIEFWTGSNPLGGGSGGGGGSTGSGGEKGQAFKQETLQRPEGTATLTWEADRLVFDWKSNSGEATRFVFLKDHKGEIFAENYKTGKLEQVSVDTLKTESNVLLVLKKNAVVEATKIIDRDTIEMAKSSLPVAGISF